MGVETQRVLDALNEQFYRLDAAEFDGTRQRPWHGWQHVVDAIADQTLRTVLDVGCGNGRFGVFLNDSGLRGFAYRGVDASNELLTIARRRLAAIESVELVRADILADPSELWTAASSFELIALFGVLHHVAGRDRREALVKALADRVAAGGHLAVSIWRFQEIDSIMAKALSDDQIATHTGLAADRLELEPGDCVLPWGTTGDRRRYCHFFDDDEVHALIAVIGLRVVLDRSADGRNGALNRYVVLRK